MISARDGRQLLIAMHDVTPFHAERMRRAEALLAAWGVEKITYLLVPNYHGACRADEDSAFKLWCTQRRPFAVRWLQHGYFHLEVPGRRTVAELESTGGVCAAADVGSPRSAEGEFARLDDAVLRDRLECGREVFRRTLGAEPEGFVAPKWQAAPRLAPILAEMGYRFTESDRAVQSFGCPGRLAAPVITWATRSFWRKQISLWGCPLLERFTRRVPLLRIAMHPFDFDHVETIESIGRIIHQAGVVREQIFYDALWSTAENTQAA